MKALFLFTFAMLFISFEAHSQQIVIVNGAKSVGSTITYPYGKVLRFTWDNSTYPYADADAIFE